MNTFTGSDWALILTAVAGIIAAVSPIIILLIQQNKKTETNHQETLQAINETKGEPPSTPPSS